MPPSPKLAVYLIGVLCGLLILRLLPVPERKPVQTRELPPAKTAAEGYYPREVTDAFGRTTTFYRQPRRIVSLAPSVTEILTALGWQSEVVAVTRWCDTRDWSAEPAVLGNLDNPNREALLALRPDVVLGSNLTPRSVYDHLASMRLGSVALDFSGFESTRESIQIIGRTLAIPGPTRRLLDQIETRKAALLARVAGLHPQKPLRTVLLYSLDNLASAGRGTWPGELIALAGAENLAATAPSPWPRLSLEALVQADPEVVLIAFQPDTPGARESLSSRVRALQADPVWSRTSAVRSNRVHLVDANLFQIPGPRFPDALQAVLEALYPQAFSPAASDPL